MPIDYSGVDRIFELSFGKLDRPAAGLEFPEPGTLSEQLSNLISEPALAAPILPHSKSQLLASASVEMWHRAIHSFLWSVVLTSASPMWASVSGYYASHFVMRAFAHSMGFFKSFTQRKLIQVGLQGGQFVCDCIDAKDRGEHAFYWKVVKGYPRFTANPLFRENNERDKRSDCAHRSFANYTDHVDSFVPVGFPNEDEVTATVEKISRIRLHSVIEPSRDDYPDLFNVQILAFQRIVAYHDYVEDRIPRNRFWRAHRRPTWCKDTMLFQIEKRELEQPSTS